MSVMPVNKTPLMLATAMAAAITVASTVPTYAAEGAEMEHCYGITKAGMNDCKTANGSCAGTAKMDHQKDAFVIVPVGTCAKIAGGSLEPMMK